MSRVLEKFFGENRGLMRLALSLPPRPLHRTVESALGGHDDPLGDIQEHGVLRGAERAPGMAAPAPRLLPNDLSPHQHAEIILEDAITSADKDRRGLAPEVGALIAIRPPGSSFRRQTAKASVSISRYST